MAKIDLPVLVNARDSFIKGLKAYLSAYNDYEFVDPTVTIGKGKLSQILGPKRFGFAKFLEGKGKVVFSSGDFDSNLTFRKLKMKEDIVFDSPDILFYKDAIIFFHHCIEQLLKDFLIKNNPDLDVRIIEESNFPGLLKRCWQFKLKSLSDDEYRKMLLDLNDLRNSIYHSGFLASFEHVEMMLGSTMIRFFHEFLRDLDSSLIEFLPYKDEKLFNELVSNAEQIKKHFDDASVPVVRFKRNLTAAMVRWLEITDGTKENPPTLVMKILDLKHVDLLEEGIEGPPCPVCSNIMVIGYSRCDIGEDENDDDPSVMPYYAECGYCGLSVLDDFLEEFCERFEYDPGPLADEVRRKLKLEKEKDNL